MQRSKCSTHCLSQPCRTGHSQIPSFCVLVGMVILVVVVGSLLVVPVAGVVVDSTLLEPEALVSTIPLV